MDSYLAHALPLGALAVTLVAACASDIRSQRIPNAVVLAGGAAGLVLSALPGGSGIANAAGGIAGGFALFLPLYLLRAMGAGDVKLMAAVGAFTGWPGVLAAALWSLAAGGVLSLAAAVASRSLRTAIGNIGTGIYLSLVRAAAFRLPGASDIPLSTQRVPYAVAIAAGTAAYVLMNGIG